MTKPCLIVTGVARSGTTALAELLNAHTGICVGIERYKFQFLRAQNYSASLFEKDRFFDFRDADTNLSPERRPAWQPVYDAMAAKWDDAAIIGDKVPDLIPCLEGFMRQNPGHKYLCIMRNLKDVALSWQARADRPRDLWPAGKGFAQACQNWSTQHDVLHDLIIDQDTRKRLMLLDYDRMYDDVHMTETALLGFLGLGREEGFSAVLTRHAAFYRQRPSRKVPRKYIEAYKAVDMAKVRGLRKLARKQMEAAADGFQTNAELTS